jgi:endonuclease YncB( thermonuclease family)
MKLHELWEKPTNSKFTQEQIDQYYSDSLTEAQKRGYVQDDGNGGHKWIHPDSQLRDRMQSLVYAYEQKHGAVAAAKWEKEANTLLEHALGQNSRPNRNGFIFNLIGEVRAYESLRTLMFSGVASVPEIAVAFQRSKGEVGMVNFAKIVWDSVRNYDDAKEMAELMGFIQDDMASIIAMDMLSVHDGDGGVGRFFRKGIAPLMKYNGNEMVVNLSRVVAMKAGTHFLKSTARKALAAPAGSKEYQRATRYLQELGIDAATVMRWMDDVQYKGLKEASTQDGNSMHAADAAKVRAALNTFINESVMRPNAAERPTWADHPIGTFVYHLKTFAYSFGKRVVGGAIREINARRGEGTSRFDALTESMVYALPALMVFTLFGAMSDELRNRIATLVGEGEWRGTWGANREDPLAMVGKWMSRSGLLTSAPFFDPVYATLTGKPSVNSFAFGAGPLASHAWDLFKPSARGRTTDVMGVSVDKRILKSIPVVNQLPYLKGVNAMPPVKNKGVAGAVYDWALSFFKDAPGPRKLKGRFSGVVTQIEDGDTAFVRDAKGKIHHIRLFGIDTNEKGQRGGNDQTSALSDMVLGKRVVISDYGNGLFGRMLGVIQLNGVDINAKMLEEGKAWYSHTYAEDLPDDMKRLYVKALNNAYRGKKSQWDGRTQLDPQDYKRMMRRFEKIKKATAEAAKPSFWESLVGEGVSGGT